MDRPPYVTALRVVATAAHFWTQIDGDAALAGVDLFALSPQRFVNALHAWLRAHTDPNRIDDLERRLSAPLAGRARVVSDSELQRDAESFQAFVGAIGGPRGSIERAREAG